MLSNPAPENRLRVLRSSRESPKSKFVQFGLFVKEWGGVATLMIALLWTAPLSWYDRIQSYIGEKARIEQIKVANVREILKKIAVLRADQISKNAIISSTNDYFAMQSSYQYLIFSELYQNTALIDSEIE